MIALFRKTATLAAFAVALLPVCGQTQKKSAAAKTPAVKIDRGALEFYVRHLFAEWPAEAKIDFSAPTPSEIPGLSQVIVTGTLQGATAQQKLLMTADGKKFIMGTIYDLKANPFRDEIALLKTDSAPSMGTPGAPVKLVLFTDFLCPYCRVQAQTLRENLLKTYPTEVRLYFKDYPLEQLHAWSKQTSIAGRCVYRQNPQLFWRYHDWVFDQQAQLTQENFSSGVLEFAKDKEIDTMQLRSCMDSRATEAEVNQSMREGQGLYIDQTPTLFINGRRTTGAMQWSQLKAMIDAEIAYQKVAKNAGDTPCCEVTPLLPQVKR
jgi:protein-disulfide isomerase